MVLQMNEFPIYSGLTSSLNGEILRKKSNCSDRSYARFWRVSGKELRPMSRDQSQSENHRQPYCKSVIMTIEEERAWAVIGQTNHLQINWRANKESEHKHSSHFNWESPSALGGGNEYPVILPSSWIVSNTQIRFWIGTLAVKTLPFASNGKSTRSVLKNKENLLLG